VVEGLQTKAKAGN